MISLIPTNSKAPVRQLYRIVCHRQGVTRPCRSKVAPGGRRPISPAVGHGTRILRNRDVWKLGPCRQRLS